MCASAATCALPELSLPVLYNPLCFVQTQITNPMFNNELSIADDSSDDDDDDVMFVNAEPVEKVCCSHDLANAL